MRLPWGNRGSPTRTWKKSWHVHKGYNRNIKCITETHKPRSFDRSIDVQTACSAKTKIKHLLNIKMMINKEPKTLYYTVIKHNTRLRTEGNEEDTSHRRVFCTFLECSQMSGAFYHSVIHGLGSFIEVMWRKTIKTCFLPCFLLRLIL